MTAEEIKILIRQKADDYADRARWINSKTGKEKMKDYNSLLVRLLEQIENIERRKSNGG